MPRTTSATSSPLLRVENLRLCYTSARGRALVVDGVSFDIEDGQIVALVGESGSGKSQTALSLMRLIEPPGEILSGSRIELDGMDLMSASEEEMRQIRGGVIAMIFQEPRSALNPFYTVGFHLDEALRLHGERNRARNHEVALETLQMVGVDDPEMRMGSYPYELSGGLCQRIMIAIAIIVRPALVIADEPTTALDVTIQAQVLELLKTTSASMHMSVLLITHDLCVVSEFADLVLVMYAGRIVEAGSAGAVLGHPRHPYTQGLLASSPELGAPPHMRIPTMSGLPPDPSSYGEACRFAPRCSFRFSPCDEYPPEAGRLGHSVACWLSSPSVGDDLRGVREGW